MDWSHTRVLFNGLPCGQFNGFDLLAIAEELNCGFKHHLVAHSNDHDHDSWVYLVEDEALKESLEEWDPCDGDVPEHRLDEREFNYDHNVAVLSTSGQCVQGRGSEVVSELDPRDKISILERRSDRQQ